MHASKKRIVVFGSVGVNRGDDLMNRVLINYFSKSGHFVESASMAPAKMAEIYDARYFSSRLKNFPKWIAAIIRSDIIIIGGGTVVQDDFGKSIGGILSYSATVILVAKIFGKEVHAVGIGINHLKRGVSRLFFNAYRLVDTLNIRDVDSLRLANEKPWLRGKVNLMPDIAFLSESYGPVQKIDPPGAQSVLISLVGESHKSAGAVILGSAFDIARRNGQTLVGLAMDDRSSEEISIFENFKIDHPGFNYLVPATAEEAIAHIACATGIVSMRLHASIIALVTETPLIVISRETKTEWIRNWIPKTMFLTLEDADYDRLQASMSGLIEERTNAEILKLRVRNQENSIRVRNVLSRIGRE